MIHKEVYQLQEYAGIFVPIIILPVQFDEAPVLRVVDMQEQF